MTLSTYRARHGDHEDRLGPRLFQGPGAFGNGAPGSVDVIHQDDPPTLDRRGVLNRKGPPDILLALCGRELDLRLGPPDPAEVVPGERQPPFFGEDLPQEDGLVEAT